MENCKYCNKKLKHKKGSGRVKMFCNANCRNLWRYHNLENVNKYYRERAIIQMRKERKDEKYMEKRRANFDRWRKNNRDKFNESCRNSMRKILKIKPSEYRV